MSPAATSSVGRRHTTHLEYVWPHVPGRRMDKVSLVVVDDNRDAAVSLAMLLEHLGAQVQVACSGPEAISAIRSRRPKAVLMDLIMPGMDGFEVARQIRSQPELSGVRLIALSGFGEDEHLRRSQEAGFVQHLVKPVDLSQLQDLVKSLSAS